MALLQAFLTALLSGLCAALMTFSITEQRDRAEARLKKLEEAVENVDAYGSFAAYEFLKRAYLLGRNQRTNEENEKELSVIADGIEARRIKAMTSVMIWCPEALPSFENLLTAMRNVVAQDSIIRAQEKPNDRRAAVEHQASLTLVLTHLRKQVTGEILRSAYAVAHRPLLLTRLQRLPGQAFDWIRGR